MITETALITGASSGIGLHLAHEFARRGHPVVITAPVESELQRIRETFKTNYNITARVIAKDLEQPNAAQEIFDELEGAHPSRWIFSSTMQAMAFTAIGGSCR